MKLEDIILTEEEIEEKGYVIENNIIEQIDINVIGHFNNCSSLSIRGRNLRIFGGYNNNSNLSFLLKAFVELFEISDEDGLNIRSISNLPCRVVFSQKFGRCIGFGHFMKDKFVLIKEFNNIDDIP